MKVSQHRKSASIATFTFFLLLLATPAKATVVVHMDLPELVRQSDLIIQGHVDSLETRWEQNSAYTYIYVTVEDPMKGERRSVATIRQPGGTIGALHVDVAGMPTFVKGEEVILFLKSGPRGTFQVLGLNQGKYQITGDFAVSHVSGIDLYNPATGRLETPALVDHLPAERLKSRIRELLK